VAEGVAGPGDVGRDFHHDGSTSVRPTGLLSLLNLFSEVSLIASGQGCPGCAGRSWRPSSRSVLVERIVDRPTMRSCPCTGKSGPHDEGS
jgi:hypothetical protein